VSKSTTENHFTSNQSQPSHQSNLTQNLPISFALEGEVAKTRGFIRRLQGVACSRGCCDQSCDNDVISRTYASSTIATSVPTLRPSLPGSE
jgi:hypothetical protein